MAVHSYLLPAWIVSKSVKICILSGVVSVVGSGVGAMILVEKQFSLGSTAISSISPIIKQGWSYITQVPSYLKTFWTWLSTNITVSNINSGLDGVKSGYDDAKSAYDTASTQVSTYKGTVLGTIKKTAKSAAEAIFTSSNVQAAPAAIAGIPNKLISYDWSGKWAKVKNIHSNMTSDAFNALWSIIQASVKS